MFILQGSGPSGSGPTGPGSGYSVMPSFTALGKQGPQWSEKTTAIQFNDMSVT